MKTVKICFNAFLLFGIILLFACQNTLQYEPNTPQLTEGWSIKEPSGTQWSEGTTSTIVLYEDKLENKNRQLILTGQYFQKKRPSQLFLNNKLIGEINFDANKEIRFDILLEDNTKADALVLKHFDIQSPFDLGISEDKRSIKLSINSITLK